MRFAGVDVSLRDLFVVRSLRNGLSGELGPVVGNDVGGVAIDRDQRIQFAHDPGARNTAV